MRSVYLFLLASIAAQAISTDCKVLRDWVPNIITQDNCCIGDVKCDTQGRVTKIFFGSSSISVKIPPELGQLNQLTELSLWQNRLIGPIPPELGKLTKLTRLILDSNNLTGSIPPELGQLTQLTVLSLYSNQLIGPIPRELGKLTQLTFLSLYGNQLIGPIPLELGQLTQLTQLRLEYNTLEGPIPNMSGLTKLTECRFAETNSDFGLCSAPDSSIPAICKPEFKTCSSKQLSATPTTTIESPVIKENSPSIIYIVIGIIIGLGFIIAVIFFWQKRRQSIQKANDQEKPPHLEINPSTSSKPNHLSNDNSTLIIPLNNVGIPDANMTTVVRNYLNAKPFPEIKLARPMHTIPYNYNTEINSSNIVIPLNGDSDLKESKLTTSIDDSGSNSNNLLLDSAELDPELKIPISQDGTIMPTFDVSNESKDKALINLTNMFNRGVITKEAYLMLLKEF